MKSAPLQVAHIGFPGSNGAAFIGYMSTDKTFPLEARLYTYSEATAYLPHCYLITDDRSLLASYRNWLADGHKSAPLFDTARSARAMEHRFEEMWRRYLDGEAPARIDIPDR